MDKNIAVVDPAGKIRDLTIRPGTTSREIIAAAKLPKAYGLSPQNGLFFGDNEEVYGQVEDGAKVFASPPAEVGGFLDWLGDRLLPSDPRVSLIADSVRMVNGAVFARNAFGPGDQIGQIDISAKEVHLIEDSIIAVHTFSVDLDTGEYAIKIITDKLIMAGALRRLGRR